ncbi:MAG TPA: hypothetical protein PKD38_07495 [Nitrospira sp.]|nr:hypothetical protein [Nitrospira sp.]
MPLGLKQILGKRDRVANAYRAVFETPEGEIVLTHLARHGFIFDTTFVQGDPQATALNEGSRRLVLSIMRMLNTDFNKLRQMMEDTQNV